MWLNFLMVVSIVQVTVTLGCYFFCSWSECMQLFIMCCMTVHVMVIGILVTNGMTHGGQFNQTKTQSFCNILKNAKSQFCVFMCMGCVFMCYNIAQLFHALVTCQTVQFHALEMFAYAAVAVFCVMNTQEHSMMRAMLSILIFIVAAYLNSYVMTAVGYVFFLIHSCLLLDVHKKNQEGRSSVIFNVFCVTFSLAVCFITMFLMARGKAELQPKPHALWHTLQQMWYGMLSSCTQWLAATKTATVSEQPDNHSFVTQWLATTKTATVSKQVDNVVHSTVNPSSSIVDEAFQVYGNILTACETLVERANTVAQDGRTFAWNLARPYDY